MCPINYIGKNKIIMGFNKSKIKDSQKIHDFWCSWCLVACLFINLATSSEIKFRQKIIWSTRDIFMLVYKNCSVVAQGVRNYLLKLKVHTTF